VYFIVIYFFVTLELNLRGLV